MDPSNIVESVGDLFTEEAPQVSEPVAEAQPIEERPIVEQAPLAEQETPAEQDQPVVQEPVVPQSEVQNEAPSDIELLRQQNERLLQTINELTQRVMVPQVPQTQQMQQQQQVVQAQPEVQRAPEFKVNVNEDEFTDIMSSPEKFNAFFTTLQNNIANAMREEQKNALTNMMDIAIPQRLSGLVSGEVRQQRVAAERAQAFVAANPDLAPYIAFVAQRHLEIVQQNPGIPDDVSLREAARISRQLLGLREPTQEQGTSPKVIDANPQKPAFAGRPGPRPPAGPQMTEVQKEIHDLLGLDNPDLM